jgi:PAS domain S-box-containing protein
MRAQGGAVRCQLMGISPLDGMEPENVIRHVPVAAIVFEAPSGRIVHANARAREMVERQLGRELPFELGPDWEIFHPDGRPYRNEEWPLVRSLTSGEEVVGEEYFNVLADGSHLSVRCSSAPIYDQQEIVGGLLVMEDITDEKRAEEERAYLAGLVENTEDAVVAMDARYLLTAWNKGAERLYGWTAEEAVGRHADEVARTNLSEQERTELRRGLAASGRWRSEAIAARKDGTTVDVELVSVALRNENGDITGYLTIHRDISERKRAEVALREALPRSETILESITDAFVAVDRDWRYTYVNERALRRIQWRAGRTLTREEVLGQGIWDLFPDAVNSEFYEKYREAMREQRPVEFEAYFAPTDEWIEAHAYPSETGLSIYYRNVNARKWAEEEIRRHTAQQAVVAELGLQALASDDLDSLMREAATLVARTLDVELTGIVELVAGGGAIRMRAGWGWSDGVVGRLTESATRDSQWGHILASHGPVVSEDLKSERRFTPAKVALEHGAVSGAGIVIQATERPFGVLVALSQSRRAFSESELNPLQAVANVLAMAVQRVEYESRLIEVRDSERRRIARDLHDEALQELTDAIARATPREPGTVDPEERLEQLAPALKRVGSQLRGAIYDLRLSEEENRPFPELLAALVELQRAMTAAPRKIELDLLDGTPAGPLGKRGTEVLRIVGEAIVNARRHSDAQHIRVVASGSGNRLAVEVADDGRGIGTVPTLTARGGFGIAAMRERAAVLDGGLDITCEPGAGTRVRLSVPFGRSDDPTEHTVRVLLVEDHTAVREAIAAQFEREPGFEVIGQAASLAAARALLTEPVDVAVVDLGLPDGNGADLIKDLRHANPRAHTLVLSASLDHAQTAYAVEHGAAATLDKTARLDEVVDAVRRLRAGETLIDLNEVVELLRFAARQRAQTQDDRRALERLTPREREVLQALAEGLDTQAIAARLHITTRTQRNHVANILTKLGVHSQLQAVLFALRYDVVKPNWA